MEFDYFYNTWIPEHALTDLRSLWGVMVYLDKDGKIKGILWFDRCSGGFNCPYQSIPLDVKDLHDVNEFGKLVVKIYPYKPDPDESPFERLKK